MAAVTKNETQTYGPITDLREEFNWATSKFLPLRTNSGLEEELGGGVGEMRGDQASLFSSLLKFILFGPGTMFYIIILLYQQHGENPPS